MTEPPKTPARPPGPLILEAADITVWERALWRIHTISGRYPSAWNDLRTAGPLPHARWDPHPESGPVSERGAGANEADGGDADRGAASAPAVSYTAGDPATCFAEVFPLRAITLSDEQMLSGWEPIRGLELLDLAGSDFLIRNGAAHELLSAPRAVCRAWAHAIWAEHGERIDGLHTHSTWTGCSAVVLFAGARSAFPEAPAFTRPLNHPDVAVIARRVGDRFGWPVLA